MKLQEIDNATAAFVFGRFNPPTIGHKKLFDKLKTVSPVRFVFVSPTQDQKKNPLNKDQKIALIDRQFPEMADYIITDPSIRTIIDVMKFLEQAGHKRVAMVVGADRTKAFNDLLAKYNGKEYNFDSIDIISAGDRDPDSEGVTGVSASKAREAAAAGDYETFKTMFVGNEGLKKNIYKAVRTGMGIKEEAAGVGIVTKQNTTPDVNKKTLGKIMKALRLK
jgi:nicotinic acid mononucleotide adenylyltransferase